MILKIMIVIKAIFRFFRRKTGGTDFKSDTGTSSVWAVLPITCAPFTDSKGALTYLIRKFSLLLTS